MHATGATRAKPKGGDRCSHRVETHSAFILAAVDARVDISLAELCEMLRREHGVHFLSSTIWRFLDRRGLTLKKTAHAEERERPDIAEQRERWFEDQPDLDPKHLVFIDETGLSTKFPDCAAGPSAASAAARPFRSHWKTTTFIGALRLEAMTAPMVLA